MPREIQKKASHRQIAHAILACKKIGIDQPLGFACLTLKYQIPDYRQDVQRIRIVIVVRTAGPECLFIQL